MMYVRRRGMAASSLLALALASGLLAIPVHALAADAAAADAAPPKEEQEVDAVVVTAPKTLPVVAASPARGVLGETEPEAVITRKFIEEEAPRVGDFSTIAIYAPNMVSTPQPNGPGLSDGGKIAMRGFSDGSYNITYDGVAWGDTNGPSHHGTAFFPNSTIGGVIIDRGPGRADDMGPANFGGQVNLLSLPLESTRSASQVITGGSFDTYQFVTTLQSGEVSQAHDAKFLANFQELSSDGYLTNNFTKGNVQMFKGDVPITDKLTATALYTHTFYLYNKSDIGDAVVSDLQKYGKNFSLSDDPTQQNYYGYNWARKQTDFEYLKLAGELGAGFSIDNTLYSFGYDNDTHSGESQISNATNVITPVPGATYPAPGKAYASSLQVTNPAGTVTDIPGYLKKNEYRVTGDIAKVSYATPFGVLTFGSNYERADTYRFIVDVNLVNLQPDYREKAATTAGPSAPYQDTPLNLQYIEFSGWKQYQPFVEFDWKPTDRITVTPGVKYVNWDLYLNAPVAEKLANGIQPLVFNEVFTKTLPFLTANYRISNNWSAYAEYAQGILLPNIGNFYVGNLASSKVAPQESTNYQLGTVFQMGKFAFDGDLYWIDFQHKIQSYVDANNQPYETNSGGATYKGVEVQGTYVLPYGASVFANYSYNTATGNSDRSNPLYNGHQLTGAPLWTAAIGARLEHDHLFVSDDSAIIAFNDKFVGAQYVNNASCSTVNTAGVCVIGATTVLTPVDGLIPSYSEADLSLTYRVSRYSIEAQVLNLFDSQSLTSAKGKAYLPGSPLFALTTAQGGGSNAPEYQVPTSFQITLKAKF